MIVVRGSVVGRHFPVEGPLTDGEIAVQPQDAAGQHLGRRRPAVLQIDVGPGHVELAVVPGRISPGAPVLEASQRQDDGRPPPPPLVFATIRRRTIDLARREDRRTAREQAATEPLPEMWFDAGAADRELAQLVQGAMSKLPDIYREVITLKVWGGLTFAEIAEALGIPANTAASRYRYGLEELRKLTREVLA